MFETVADKPWECVHGYFLLFDFVHLLKNIRNNWLTEKTGSIDFKIEDESFTARWPDLLDLYKLESNLTLNCFEELWNLCAFEAPLSFSPTKAHREATYFQRI